MSERREITRLGVPFLIGVLSSSLDGVIDTAMMGRFSTDGLVAVAGASAIFDVFTTVAVATVVGHQILSARFAGRDDDAGLRASFAATARLSILVVLPLLAACVFFGTPLAHLTLAGSGPAVIELGGSFLTAVAPTLPLVVAFTALTATMNAHQSVKAPTVAALVVAGSNILLDWLLIYGPGPFPRLGVVGDGLATSLAWAIGLALLLVFAARAGYLARLRTRAVPAPVDFETSVTKLSWPAIVSTAVDYTSTAVFFGVLGGLGAQTLGGGRIAFHVLVLIYGFGAAFGAAVRILIGRAAGADDATKVRATWVAGRSLLLPAGLAIAVVLIAVKGWVARAFSPDPVLQDQLAAALVMVALIVPLIGWTLANAGLVKALGRTKLDLYANLAAAAGVQLPIAWLLGSVLGLGVTGAFAGMAAYWITRGALLELWARRSLHELDARSPVGAGVTAER
ncbi:MATE family efflux transporter [Kribbella sandramycini]|uniref:Probable multidrug resistance protein NorM n=1 Tax=Kribbella sandramycini TaxID=60450 RepID=A0A7Y4L294_9ACTN|nr:MATE family efflux transporter [Kribbella sandramycini]MBB6566323.1 putative MATE family efflux protein [Kribbella sandramycini]NOL43015.1 MATE family efflux transporter [Kribbella sandramycini]